MASDTVVPAVNSDARADDAPEHGEAALGGAMRNALRTAVTRIRLQNPIVGSFPRTPKVPTKAVATASDNLSFLMDVTGYMKEAKEQIAEKTSSKAKAVKLVQWATTTWMPNLVRSTILGSVTWTSYEVTTASLLATSPSTIASPHVAILVPWVFGVSIVAGTVAGSLHGSLWSVSERAMAAFKHEPSAFRIPGVLLSHTLTHLAMFSSYEATKAFLMHDIEGDHTDIDGALCIVGAAATSGLVGEIATYYAAPFEQQSFTTAMHELRTLPLPTLRSMAPSGFSTMLGWLAYEYAKETFDGTSANS
ncbi:hypothetical protein, variant 1 [Aphanomyces invadans]|uniref:Uncharacterized protein n=1 Tax=Aphanomyces invadans TaxID=157072 RepID=A0A024UCS9_9STRA|nr:hypothetical protein, variant 1 [Aphanomyces invadans]ETW04074.1 hypothetical protein, variant 1 [Aphanomyces invadans]|eukprot:XP_008867030.1 hypothetical protein, variant 1 [Aphanomyces invadans]